MSADPSQFEEPILQIRRRIEELSALEPEPARQTEIDELRLKLTKVSHEIYSKLTPWQKTLVARHALRPYTLDFVSFPLTTQLLDPTMRGYVIVPVAAV